MLNDPQIVYTTTPQNIMKYVDFMYKTGTIKIKPDSWKDLFFPNAQSFREAEPVIAADIATRVEVDLAAIRAAHARIAPHIRRTPVLSSRSLDEAAGATLFFKCENLQRVAAFKARGACNAVLSLDDAEAARGVVTHSSGNHGAALAWAATRRGIPSWIVMPSNSAKVKQDAVRGFGGNVRLCEPTLPARETMCASSARGNRRDAGASVRRLARHRRAGHGGAGIARRDPDLDAVITPVGGGGLLSGTAIAAKGIKPCIAVYGAEPEGADDGCAIAARRPHHPADRSAHHRRRAALVARR